MVHFSNFGPFPPTQCYRCVGRQRSLSARPSSFRALLVVTSRALLVGLYSTNLTDIFQNVRSAAVDLCVVVFSRVAVKPIRPISLIRPIEYQKQLDIQKLATIN